MGILIYYYILLSSLTFSLSQVTLHAAIFINHFPAINGSLQHWESLKFKKKIQTLFVQIREYSIVSVLAIHNIPMHVVYY